MQCPECQTENPDQAKFCLECGAKLSLACPECGALLPPQAKFCFECGTRTGAPPPTPALEPEVVTLPAPLVPPESGVLEQVVFAVEVKAELEDIDLDAPASPEIRSFLPRARILSLASGAPLPEQATGTCLFADISGFTPLTESLAQNLTPQQGAEVLTEVINSVLEAVIAQVHSYGGDVLGFAGDAITCWFPDSSASVAQALRCGLAMQCEMPRFEAVVLPDGTTHALGMKVGLAHGPVRRLLAGGPEYGQFEVLTGATLTRMADAEHQAETGEIICGPEIAAFVGETATWGPSRNGFLPLLSLAAPAVTPLQVDALPELTLGTLQPYFPQAIFSWLASAQGRLLAELRPVVSAFVHFEGLDYEGDIQVQEKLNAYVITVQRIATQYGGSMVRLDYGDKGSVAHVLFGAPVAHEDDEPRAVGWALDLQAAVRDLPFITAQAIGVSKGQVHAGALGATTRRGYTIMGDEVNASARLMQACQPGQILVDQRVMQAAQQRFSFHRFPGYQVKGKYEPVPVGMPLGRLPAMQQMAPTGPLVGRDVEVGQMDAALDAVLGGAGRVLRIEGRAGVGKSRLVSELVQRAMQRGVRALVGSGQSVGRSTAYLPWREVFQALFGLQSTWPAAQQAMQIENLLRWMNPDWLVRVPLFGDLLGVDIPDNPTTASFDSRLRQQSLFALIGDLLARMSEQQPLLILVEDCHWIDAASAALVEALAVSLAQARALLVVSHRPPEDPDRPILPSLVTLEHCVSLDLNELAPEAVRLLATHRLGGELPPDILAFIEERAQGNPFFVEELAETLRETSHLQFVDGRWMLASGVTGRPRLPDTIQGVVLARLDRLDGSSKLTVKVASVVGRVFEVELVQEIHPDQVLDELLHEQIETLERRDFVREELPEPRQSHRFKHNLTQEVAYATLLYSQRRTLHRAVAEWYEQALETGAIDSLSPYYPLLVHHYHHSEDGERELRYARLAGEQAAAQFANAEALDYIDRALELLEQVDWEPERAFGERYALLLVREKVYGLLGERKVQADDLAALETLADELDDDRRRAEVALRHAEYHEATSDFAAAIEAAKKTERWAEKVGDLEHKIEGMILAGRALMRQGEFTDAWQTLKESLKLAQQHQHCDCEASSLHYRGTVLYFLCDYDAARDQLEQARRIRHDLGDQRGEAISLSNLAGVCHALGDLSEAKAISEQILTIYRAIGDRLKETSALTNLGIIYHALGELAHARERILLAMGFRKAIGDRRGEALDSKNLALVLHDLGESEMALDYCAQALEITQAIGDRGGEGYSLTYLALVHESLGELEMAAAAYEQAARLRREIGQQARAMDDVAGLARVALKQNQVEQAFAYAEEVLDWIASHGLQGIEYPIRVYLTCADVLAAVGQDEHSANVLAQAWDHLRERAERISDNAMRQRFLEQVPLHHELCKRLGIAS